jgi:23S rRNA-/tRNA-specific pseudouridylate synthase
MVVLPRLQSLHKPPTKRTHAAFVIFLLLSICSHQASALVTPRILLETDRLLVIDKPPGIPHHSTDKEDGILHILRQHHTDYRL